MPCQRQRNSYDCGVFAVAFITTLAFGTDPCTVSFDRKSIRAHFIQCLARKEILPFPAFGLRGSGRIRQPTLSVDVYCSCRLTKYRHAIVGGAEWALANCSICQRWFHRRCENIPDECFTKKKYPFMCSSCHH